MSVAQAQAEIHSAEFAEWMAFDRIEPIGVERIEQAIANLSSMYFNTHRGEHADPKAPIDFMPYTDRPETKPQTLEDAKRDLLKDD